jgi:hypothetical protein
MERAYRSPRPDGGLVIKRLLLLASTLCTVIVVLSFTLFAVEKANASSKAQQDKVENVDRPAPSAGTERERERKHTKVREVIDDLNDGLTSPFSDIVTSNNIWVQRGIPALFGVLVYFLVLRVLAGYAVRLRV